MITDKLYTRQTGKKGSLPLLRVPWLLYQMSGEREKTEKYNTNLVIISCQKIGSKE